MPSDLLSVRVSKDILARMNEVGKTIATPHGIKVTQSAIVRMLLLRGLHAVEAEQRPAPEAPPGDGELKSDEGEGSRFESWAY